MKILYVSDSFKPESTGGAGQVVFDSARFMQDHGHQVHILTTTTQRSSESEGIVDQLSVTRLYFPEVPKFIRSYISVYNPFLARKVRAIIRREKPDVVHFHNVHKSISFASIKWAKKSGAKVFFTAHDVLSFAYTRLYHFIDTKNPRCQDNYHYHLTGGFLLKENGKAFNPFRNICIRRYLNTYVDHIFAVSHELKKAMEQNGIKNIDVLYNGIQSEDFEVHKEYIEKFKLRHNLLNKQIIFFGGRGMPDKGAEVLIEILPEILRQAPAALLVIAIDNPVYQAKLQFIIDQNQVAQHVYFSGFLKGQEFAAMLHASDVILVPSLSFDSAPLMVMQAMAVGKPVVGTCFGGTPEIVTDEVTGYIVNPYNQEELITRITELLTNREHAQKMGSAGFARIKEYFTLDRQLERSLLFYNKSLIRR